MNTFFFFFHQNLFLYCADTMGWLNKARYNDPWYDGCYSGPILSEATQNEAFSKAEKWKNSDWKSSTATDNFVHVSRTRWQTRDNTLRDVTGRKNWLLLCLFPGLDTSPPHWYQWLRRGNAEKHIWLREDVNRRTQKMQNMHRTLAAHQSTSLLEIMLKVPLFVFAVFFLRS